LAKRKKKIDLQKLSKEEKIELLLALDKKQEHIKKRKAKYDPHDGQLKIHRSHSLERYLFCGNGFGKTCILANEVHWAATGFNPITKETFQIPAKMCLLLDDPYKIDDFLDEYRKWNIVKPEQLAKQGKPYYTKITYKNGSSVTAISHNVETLKLEGSEWTHIFADEPPPERVFNSLYRGGRIKNRPLKILLAGTPIVGAWLRRNIYEKWIKGELPHVECFRGYSRDNKENQEKDWLDRFSARLTSQEKKVRLEGHFFDLAGQALAGLFDRSTHLVSRDLQWDKNNPCVVGIDPHPHKPNVAVLIGVDRHDKIYYIKESSQKMAPRQYAAFLKEFYSGYRVVDIVCDSLGSSEMTGGEGFKSFIQVLREEGIRVRATTYDEKGDENFITRICEALHVPEKEDNFGEILPKLRIVEINRGIINDIENVQWQRDKVNDSNKPKLEITNRDFLAALKYALAAKLNFNKGSTKIYKRPKPSSYGYTGQDKKETWSEF